MASHPRKRAREDSEDGIDLHSLLQQSRSTFRPVVVRNQQVTRQTPPLAQRLPITPQETPSTRHGFRLSLSDTSRAVSLAPEDPGPKGKGRATCDDELDDLDINMDGDEDEMPHFPVGAKGARSQPLIGSSITPSTASDRAVKLPGRLTKTLEAEHDKMSLKLDRIQSENVKRDKQTEVTNSRMDRMEGQISGVSKQLGELFESQSAIQMAIERLSTVITTGSANPGPSASKTEITSSDPINESMLAPDVRREDLKDAIQAIDNRVRTHCLTSLYGLMGSSNREEPPPPYYIPNTYPRVPDFWPEEVRDETGQPLLRPDWNGSWAGQAAWVPKWKEHYFSTIPPDSELSRLVCAVPRNAFESLFLL